VRYNSQMRRNQWRQGFLIGLLIIIGFGLISLIWGLFGKMKIAVTEAHNAERQYEALEERKRALEENLATLSTERGQEAAVRTAFGVARPGEEVIVVVPPEAKATTSPESWWQRALDWIGF
jgi:cell division protein FtsB